MQNRAADDSWSTSVASRATFASTACIIRTGDLFPENPLPKLVIESTEFSSQIMTQKMDLKRVWRTMSSLRWDRQRQTPNKKACAHVTREMEWWKKGGEV